MILKPPLFAKPIHGHPLGPDGNLTGYWLMNEGRYNSAFTKVFDVSENNNTGTLVGDTAWVPGKFGSALKFDGATDVINIGTNPKLGFTSEDFSVYLYFKITDSSESDWIYSKGQANNDGFYIQMRNDNRVVAVTAQDGAQQVTETTTVYLDNVWHSLVVTRLGSYIHIYLDGIECAYFLQPAITNPDDASARVAYISGYFGDYGIVGLIDHAAIWNGRALSSPEIALLYREPFYMFEQEPIELWSAATQGEEAPPVGMAGAMTTNTGYWGW